MSETTSSSRLPLSLWAAFAAILAIGLLLYATHSAREESSLYQALDGCDAAALPENDGISDSYGLVCFRQNTSEIANFCSMCATNPEMALRIYHRAINDSAKDAKLVAIHAAFFLRHHLGKSEIETLAGFLKLSQAKDQQDVSKAAQRRLSELIVLNNLANKDKYEELPANLEAGTPHRIQTHEDGPEGKRFLRIRWSDPATALAWWQAFAAKGNWDAERGQYIIN